MTLIETWMADISNTVAEALQNAMEDTDPRYPPKSVIAEYWFEDESYIEITLKNSNDVKVRIVHRDEDTNSRECPNVISYIEDNLPSWAEFWDEFLENNRPWDEWTEHGFRDAADYYHYRYG